MLEIACFEITSAETALLSVADRIEFCSEQHLGGLTPDIEEFRDLKSIYSKPIYVMIRPVGGGVILKGNFAKGAGACLNLNMQEQMDSYLEFWETVIQLICKETVNSLNLPVQCHALFTGL